MTTDEQKDALTQAYRFVTQDEGKTFADVLEDHEIINDTDSRRPGASRKITLSSPYALPWKDGRVTVGYWYGEYSLWRTLTSKSGEDVPPWALMTIHDEETLSSRVDLSDRVPA